MKTVIKYYSFAGIIILVFGIFTTVKAQGNDEKEQARVFIQKFYDEYFKKSKVLGENRIGIDATAFIIKNKPQWFSNPLLVALKYNKDSGGVSFPFLSQAAMFGKSDYKAGNIEIYGNHLYVDIHSGLVNGSKNSDPIANHSVVVVEICKTDNHWEILNFIYPNPNSGKSDNFLELMDEEKRSYEEFKKNPKSAE